MPTSPSRYPPLPSSHPHDGVGVASTTAGRSRAPLYRPRRHTPDSADGVGAAAFVGSSPRLVSDPATRVMNSASSPLPRGSAGPESSNLSFACPTSLPASVPPSSSAAMSSSAAPSSSSRPICESLRARLYAVLSATEFELIADLTERTPSPPDDEVAAYGGGEPGDLLLVLLQKGRVVDMAYLFLVRRPPPSQKEKDMEENSSDNESKEETSLENSSDNEYEEEKYAGDLDPEVAFQLRLWPTFCRVNLIMFEPNWCWTKVWDSSWLPAHEKNTLASLMDIESNDVNESTAITNWTSVARVDFEGKMVCSLDAQKFVRSKLTPSLFFFDVGDLSGKGISCNVRLCTCQYDRKDYAIKIIKISKVHQIRNEPREVTIHSSFRSPCTVKFWQAWTESQIHMNYDDPTDMSSYATESGDSEDFQCDKYLMIQMEHCPRTLQNYLATEKRKVDVGESQLIFESVTRGLKLLHEAGVVHRDLKPGNILFGHEGAIRICDFGQSCLRPNFSSTFNTTPDCGTPGYCAPELVAGKKISEKVDIYSLGIIYLELFHSFDTRSEMSNTFISYTKEDGSTVVWEGDLQLFKKMTSLEPRKRPSAADIMEHVSKRKTS